MRAKERLRVVTYNVHHCRGTDLKLDPARIAAVLAALKADVIALQELDVGRRRTGARDQAGEIAAILGMRSHFHPAMHVLDEQYGDAILTALPVRLVRADALPRLTWPLEPRGALWVAVEAADVTVQILTTHLGLRPAEQRAQVAELTGPGWLGHPDCTGPTVLLGDFNAWRGTRPYAALVNAGLRDAQRAPNGGPPRRTYPSWRPFLRIDHVFTRGPVEVAHIAVPDDPLTRVASDHRPLVADLLVG